MTVSGSDLGWDASDDQTLLASAEAAGIELLSSCRNGTCRACICRLEDGAVRYLIEWPGLSAEEKALGWVLPCVAVPVSDGVLEARVARRRESI